MLMPAVLLAETVVLERRVARIDAVVAELARKSGRDLRVRHELDDEAVLVALGPHGADETMALLARATSARWARDGAATWLERPADLRRRQARDDAAAYGAEAARRFAPLLDPTDARPWAAGTDRATAAARSPRAPDFGRTTEGMMRDESRVLALRPAGRLLSRLVRAVTPAQIGAVAPGHRGFLSPQPGRWEMPLLGATSASVGQYVEERNAVVASLANLTPERADAAKEALDMRWKTDGALAAPPVLHLTLDHGVRGDASFSLFVRDAKGGTVDIASLWIPSIDGGAKGLPGYAAWVARPVELGARSTAFVVMMRGERADPAFARLAADPVANEPLGLFLGESLDALALAVGGGMVCALPDEAGEEAGSQLQSRPKLGEVADGLAQSVEFETQAGVTVGRARYPSFSRRMKSSRAALRGFLAELAAGIPRLAAVARYALSQGEDAERSGLDGLTIAAAGRGDVAGDTGIFESRDLLRVYGALSHAQQAALGAGTPVAVGEMPPAARGCLETLLFTRDTLVDLPSGTGVYAPWIVDGLSPAATLACPRLKRTLVAAATNGRGELYVSDASSLGYLLWQQRQGQFVDPKMGYPLVDKARFLTGSKTELNPVVRITPDASFSGRLNDLDLNLGGRAVPYAELPPEHLKEAQKTFDYYEKLDLGRKP